MSNCCLGHPTSVIRRWHRRWLSKKDKVGIVIEVAVFFPKICVGSTPIGALADFKLLEQNDAAF